MSKIFKKITDLIGNTPLVELGNYSKSRGLNTPVIAKVEYFNPGGSVKDRIGLAMIEAAEKNGTLKPGATIIEPTSGNTGVGLALVSAVKGYKLILTMPETMSVERRNLVKAYGATVKLTSGKDGMPEPSRLRRSCATLSLARSSWSSLRTQPTRRNTMRRRVKRYGKTLTERLTSSLLVWALVAPSAVWRSTLRSRILT